MLISLSARETRAAMIAGMFMRDLLAFSPEIRGWDNLRVYYEGQLVASVHSSRDHHRCWWAVIHCGSYDINLGLFNCRDEGKRAVLEWFAGLDIVPD